VNKAKASCRWEKYINNYIYETISKQLPSRLRFEVIMSLTHTFTSVDKELHSELNEKYCDGPVEI
jgi:hypothetical protein